MPKPDRKVGAGLLTGSLVTIIIWVAGLFGVPMDAEVAAALATVLTFIVAYLVPNPEPKQ